MWGWFGGEEKSIENTHNKYQKNIQHYLICACNIEYARCIPLKIKKENPD